MLLNKLRNNKKWSGRYLTLVIFIFAGFMSVGCWSHKNVANASRLNFCDYKSVQDLVYDICEEQQTNSVILVAGNKMFSVACVSYSKKYLSHVNLAYVDGSLIHVKKKESEDIESSFPCIYLSDRRIAVNKVPVTRSNLYRMLETQIKKNDAPKILIIAISKRTSIPLLSDLLYDLPVLLELELIYFVGQGE